MHIILPPQQEGKRREPKLSSLLEQGGALRWPFKWALLSDFFFLHSYLSELGL